MSDEEPEELFNYCGTPLEPYDEDAFPKRRPIAIEEQVATDAQGRRRFHGAFTGGFSAGFFNTVGSLEGWLPGEFKSSREEKAEGLVQKPEDFMDDEDTGEFGIAPQKIKAKKEFAIQKKRSRTNVSLTGPIPGEPVFLENLLTSGNETVGNLLLRNMSFKDRVKKRQEMLANKRVYGCVMPIPNDLSEDIRSREYVIPNIYKQFLKNPKVNTFGLGYEGLERPHLNLFQSSKLVIRDKDDKKFSIAGQAFGVGAFEEDDDDIYSKEDMSNYDFELTKEEKKSSKSSDNTTLVFDMFEPSTSKLQSKKTYPPPVIPHSFSGIHKVKKSRFEPIMEKEEEEHETRRERINPAVRAKYLGEEAVETYTASTSAILKQETEQIGNNSNISTNNSTAGFDFNALNDRFVSSSQGEDVHNILEPVKKDETLHGTEQMRDAVRMKMFGPLTRITTDWQPCPVLCKRFNVPEPLSGSSSNEGRKKRTKNLIFQAEQINDEPKLKPGISSEPSMPLEVAEIKTELMEITENNENNEEVKIKESTDDDDDDAVEVIPLTEKIGIEEKTDLYKAVFLSSSESEDETEKEEEGTAISSDDKITDTADKLSFFSDLLPKVKPLREGILSNLNFKAVKESPGSEEREMKKENIVDESSSDANSNPAPHVYGPLLPKTKMAANSMEVLSENDESDEWIEKDEVVNIKTSKHKKEKKHKHKKHKHKKKKR